MNVELDREIAKRLIMYWKKNRNNSKCQINNLYHRFLKNNPAIGYKGLRKNLKRIFKELAEAKIEGIETVFGKSVKLNKEVFSLAADLCIAESFEKIKEEVETANQQFQLLTENMAVPVPCQNEITLEPPTVSEAFDRLKQENLEELKRDMYSWQNEF